MRHSQEGGHLYGPELLAHREKKRFVGPAIGEGAQVKKAWARVKDENGRESNVSMGANQILVWTSQIIVWARVKY